ncbi:galactose-proton symporter [Salmonella enterica subsp. enterica serovar Agona str. 57.A.08]|nr:sugar porter family MFS transporter [Salmonella enterica]CCU24197.1 galactose-proton symporter [Salmonella enterica subsp. enterica serovar Agona str. 57.A.08]
MPDNKKQGRSNKAMTFFVCFLAALAGLLFGLDIGVIAGALPFISDEFQITAHTQEWVVSSMMFGAAVGAVGSGWLSFKLGRKKSLMIGAILFVAGSLFSAAAPNVEVLIISRVLLGLAVGVASYTAPLYLSEIAPEKIRGSMISMYQLMITIGILGAYLSDTAFSYSGAWRWMLGVIIIPAILLLIGVFFLPDSPRWFAAKRRFHDAERVLLRLRDTSAEAKRELDEIRESLQVKQSGWALFKENSNFRRAVFLGILLQGMQQFTGVNVIMYYAPKIFELAGYTNTTEQMWGTVIVGLTNVLATFIAIGLVDRWGRKPTLTLGFLVMAIGMGILGTMMHIGIHSPSAQYFAIVMQQFTGMNVIMYYAPKIFELAGYTNTTEQMWGTVIVGLTNVLATFIAIGLVDRWGRKPTLTLGFLVMAIGMGILGTMMHIGIHSPSAQYFAIAMLLMFIIGFAMSAGPLIWVLCSEIQPLKGRDFGITCSTATNWIANMIVGATFLTMLNNLGNANTFWVYAGLNVLFILLTLWLVPETKHVSLEHIERNLMKGRKLREIGAHD